MPLPHPHKGEKESEFVNRCMSSDMIHKDFPDNKRALAVCFSLFEQSKRKKKKEGKAEEVTWDEVEAQIKKDGFIIHD